MKHFTYDGMGRMVRKCGHKGLFFDRLDAGVYDASTGGEMERLVPNARGLYYARNRHHKPEWGRWLQQDPNAMGLPVQAGLGFHGDMLGAGVQNFSLGGHYGNGVNIFGYVGGSPWIKNDPAGLSFFGINMPAVTATMGKLGTLGAEAAGSCLGWVQGQIASAMVTYYGQMGASLAVGLAEGVYMEASGTGFGPAASGMMLMESVSSLRGNGALLEFTAENFRTNLSRLTGVSLKAVQGLFDAHHGIPKGGRVLELMEQLGIEDMIHNPLFGQWIEQRKDNALHTAMHTVGEYEEVWIEFLQGLVGRGLSAPDARQSVITFYEKTVIPQFAEYGMTPMGLR